MVLAGLPPWAGKVSVDFSKEKYLADMRQCISQVFASWSVA